MAQPTPGPFKYSLNVGPTKALIVEADGSTVVELCNRTRDSRFAANVRLFAAAPDMLAALKDILSGSHYIRQHHGDLSGVGWERSDAAARAAIAKAEGRS